MLTVLLAAGCVTGASPTPTPTGKTSAPQTTGEITLATTTSTYDSGLLDYLLPIFKQQANIEVKVVATGTGQALTLGRNGDADALLVHDPQGEETLVADGYAIDREKVMYNDFVIVGPEADPAGIKGLTDATVALQRIAAAKTPFVSRGDNSGTHAKEKELWAKAGIEPDPKSTWYVSSGQGMGDSLNMANQKGAYALSDRGTFLSYRGNVSLKVLVQGDPTLFNPYHVMAVNPAKYPHVKYDSAKRFIAFMTAYETQQKISTFGVDRFGQPLFFPDSEKWPTRKAN